MVCLGHLCGNYENMFYAGCGGTNVLDTASYKGDFTGILSNPIDLLNSCLDILWNIKWILCRKKIQGLKIWKCCECKSSIEMCYNIYTEIIQMLIHLPSNTECMYKVEKII